MKKKWIFIPIAAVLVIGVILGSFLDLEINKGIYDAKNGFGLFIAAFGETPAYIAMGFIAYGFIHLAINHYKLTWQRIILIAVAVLGIAASTYFQGKHIFDKNAYYNTDKLIQLLGYGIAFLIALLGACCGYFFFRRTTCSAKQLLLILIIAYALLAAANGFNQIIKIIMCRPRYRVVVDHPDVFCNWWESGRSHKKWLIDNIPGYISEDFKSFPSGHMTNIVTLFYILPLLKRANKNIKIKDVYLILCACVWGIIVAYTRIRVGAHFLSDVSMGSLIAVIFAYVVNEFYLHFDKKFETAEVANQ